MYTKMKEIWLFNTALNKTRKFVSCHLILRYCLMITWVIFSNNIGRMSRKCRRCVSGCSAINHMWLCSTFFENYIWENIDDRWWIRSAFCDEIPFADSSGHGALDGRRVLSDEHTKHVFVFAERFPVAARRRFAGNTQTISRKNDLEIKWRRAKMFVPCKS